MEEAIRAIDAEMERLSQRAKFLRSEKMRIRHGIEVGAVFCRDDQEFTIESVEDGAGFQPCAEGVLIDKRHVIEIEELKRGDWYRKSNNEVSDAGNRANVDAALDGQ